MNIPKTIKVGGLQYKVRILDDGEFDGKTGGEISVDRGWIKLVKGDRQFMEQTLIHELFHAINMEMSEETIEFLAQAIYQVVVDNPNIFSVNKSKGGEAKHG